MSPYISHGDFSLTLDAATYWLKYVFVWSFQTGAPNLDGVIRLPGRLLNLLVFQGFGNVVAAYFFLAMVLAICFVSFWCFSRYFLKVRSVSVSIITALLFTLNPIFLGNFAKVGLIMAVAMLPLCLWMVQRAFERERIGYFIIVAMLLNISLIHPFTFAVNACIVGGYFIFRAFEHKDFLADHKLGLAGIAGLALFMNAYFLLPVMQLGTVSKEAISQDITSEPIDYTALIDIANTGDIVTALSLSKNVLKDFEFFNATYAPVYFAATFLLYGVLLGLYVYHERQLKTIDKWRFAASMAAFLVLVLLSTGTLFHIDAIIKWLINLPGGWIFRSPLKWQLYVPFFLCMALAIVIVRTQKKFLRIGAQAAVCVIIVGMGGYLAADIYNRLLVPRHINQLAQLAETDLSYKTMLFVSSPECSTFAQENPDVFTEFNQIVISRTVQLKRVSVEDLGSVHMADYDYAMSCKEQSQKALAQSTAFNDAQDLVDGSLVLYKNTKPNPHIFAFDQLFALATLRNVNIKHDFIADQLHKDLRFVEEDKNDQPATGVYDIFEGLSTKNIKDGALTVSLVPTGSEKQTLYVTNEKALYYKIDGQKVDITTAPKASYKELAAGKQNHLTFTSAPRKTLELTYTNPAFDFSNLIPNASLEEDLWEPDVWDCNRYDDNPKIAMNRTREQATDGQRALQLEAERHIACTGPPAIPVKEDSQYLLSFDYQSVGSKPAGFNLAFNDQDSHTTSERLQNNKTASWEHFSKVIEVPKGASTLNLTLYAYADDFARGKNVTRYDNFSLVEVPALQNNMYLVSQAPVALKTPLKVDYQITSPTEKHVQVSGATTPFYLAVGETYHDKWQLSLDGGATVASSAHIKLNNGVNGWYVDPAALCGQNNCHKNDDGSYDMSLVVSFAPQKWFIIGLVVSTPAWLGGIGYVVYDWLRHRSRARRFL